MKPFMIRYDWSKIATGKLQESVILRGEVTVFAKNKEEAIAIAKSNGWLPQFAIDHPSCMDIWAILS